MQVLCYRASIDKKQVPTSVASWMFMSTAGGDVEWLMEIGNHVNEEADHQ